MKLFAALFGLFIALCLVGSSFQQMVNSTLTGKAKNETLMGVKTNETISRESRRWERWERRERRERREHRERWG